LTPILLRFWLGALGGFGAGLIAFRLSVFDPGHVAFHVLTLGALTAGVLALMRSGAPGQAAALAAAFALFRFGLVERVGWLSAASGIVIGVGVLLVAWIFDLLAPRLRFGKFLILGPLLGGLLLAVTPLMEFQRLMPLASTTALLQYAFLGVVLGDGVGLGVEIADLLLPSLGVRS
jgi:hypothetical protein